MDSTIPSAFQTLFLQFQPVFTAPSFVNFVTLVTGWMLCPGRHTLSRVIQHAQGPGRRKHYATLYRFFSRAVWDPDRLGQALLGLVLPLIPEGPIYALTDDTLCRKSGPHLWGAGMHHDPLNSTYGRGTKAGRKAAFAFGHNWVVLSLWVPLPWNRKGGVAIPLLWRLYRPKKRCPAQEYRPRTELAQEMIQTLASWIPAGRKLVVVGDREYACQTLVQGLPQGVDFVGPMMMEAAFYDFPGPHKGRGRRRKKGKRLPSPAQLAANSSIPWTPTTLSIYGRRVAALVKTQTGLWYRVAGTRPVRMIVTRDPKGRIEDRAYFSTDPSMTVEEVAQGFSRRWAQEVLHRDTKQCLGLEDPQNGWWRRPQGKRAAKKKAGPQPHRTRGERAVRRTAPLALLTYALVIVWYFQHGSITQDVRRARERAPWYRHKRAPSFADMLQAARRELWVARFSAHPALRAVSAKIQKLVPEWLVAA
jgi:hypothetical protein